jgi:hypothetical protein
VPPPEHHSTTVYKYESNTSQRPQSPPTHHQPSAIPPGGITIYPTPAPQTTVYKTETINTTTSNKQYRSPTPSNNNNNNNNYPDHPYNNGAYPPTHQHTQHHHHHPQHPNEPSVVVYKTTTTTNTRSQPRLPEREPLLHPFPVDGPIITEVDSSPPKRVEDLMASFGDTSEIHYTNKRVQIAEKPLTPNNHNLSATTTKVYSSEPEEKSKAVTPSKNVAGPPVYYPPNHELFTHKEESGGYRAQVRVCFH